MQAKHWYAEEFLKSIRTQQSEPKAKVAIALPGFPRYESLVADAERALATLRIVVLFVTERGAASTRIGTLQVGSRGA